MKEILEAVMRRLKEQVPDLAYVSEDWGQMDYYNEAPPVKFPCALISVSHIGFESETWGLRRARLTFLIRIADCPVLTGNMAAPEQHRSRAFGYLRLDGTGGQLPVWVRYRCFQRYRAAGGHPLQP